MTPRWKVTHVGESPAWLAYVKYGHRVLFVHHTYTWQEAHAYIREHTPHVEAWIGREKDNAPTRNAPQLS